MTGALLTVKEAASELGRTVGFVRSLIAGDHVDGRKIGGRWYVTARSLNAWLAAGEPEPDVELVVMPERVMPRGYRGAA